MSISKTCCLQSVIQTLDNESFFHEMEKTRVKRWNLDKPWEKEDHGDEEDESFPWRKTVERLVHDEHPAFLGRRHVHREETGR